MIKQQISYIFILLSFIVSLPVAKTQDWADLSKYRKANDTMNYLEEGERRVVFMGNSIFENWATFNPTFFKKNPIVNRGISGQTTPQMLVRFRADVIDLKPHAVIILAGTNDVAENTGPTTLKMILDNIFSMVQLAQTNDIEVVLCSILPTRQYPWNLYIKPTKKIERLNIALRNFARTNDIVYIDFYTDMVDEKKGMVRTLTYDGVHPNMDGYEIMEEHMQPVIDQLIGRTGQTNTIAAP